MYRTRLIVSVLHEDPIPESYELDDIVREGADGAYVLDVDATEAPEELSDDAMRDALIDAGSEPGFFNLGEAAA